jgi:hypothetical protein
MIVREPAVVGEVLVDQEEIDESDDSKCGDLAKSKKHQERLQNVESLCLQVSPDVFRRWRHKYPNPG